MRQLKDHRSLRVFHFCGVVCALFVFVVCDPVAGQESSETLILEHADSTELISTDAATIYLLYGDVRFTQGATSLSADRASWDPNTGTIEFDGSVSLHEPGRIVLADHLVYQRNDRSVFVLGNVLVEDTTERFSLRTERGYFDRTNDVALADSLPILRWDFMLDSSLQTIIQADTIIFKRRDAHGIGNGSVRVTKGNWTADGDHGEIWPDSGRAILTGSPHAAGIGGTISGDTLILNYPSGEIEQITAIGQATGSYTDTASSLGGTNLLKGQRADFFLRDDKLEAIRVVGQAFTDHVPADSSEGSNHASGDSLWLRFDAGRLVTMTVEGGAQGRYVTSNGTISDTIDYRGSRIIFTPDSGRIDLETEAQLEFGAVKLESDMITYWTEGKNLLAYRRDSLDATGEPRFDGPRLVDGDQVVTGDLLTYNIETRRGRIRGSRTELEDGIYRGDDFRKYSDSVFFVIDGTYSTCDLDKPHFRFEGRNMKVIRDDKVISRPVVLRIGEIPVLILPFYIFPIRKGRHSGFLPLRFGNFERGKRFIGNVGYYWAASDYWDGEGALDFNEETGIRLRGVLNYALRYKFHGSLSGSYARESRQTATGETKSTRWSVKGTHQQTLSPTASLSGTANFLSDNSYYQDYSFNQTDRRNRSLRSQLNFRKRFPGMSLTAFAEATKNLDTDSRRLRLPRINLSFFERRILSPDSGADARWYHNGYVGLNSSLTHFASQDPIPDDTTGGLNKKRYVTVHHSGRVRFPQRFLSHITVTPNVSFTETWYYVFNTNLARADSVTTGRVARRASGSLGLSANTNLYGFVRPRLFGVSAIRHSMTPRISYSFTPAVTRNDELRRYTGTGGGSARRSQSVGFSLSNVFDAKLHEGDNEQKVSLLNANFSTRYDFERDTRRWGNLNGSARTTLAQKVELAGNATWDLYDPATLDLQWTNPRLTNLGFTAGLTLRGDASALSRVTELGVGDNPADSSLYGEEIPINASFSYRYNETRNSGIVTKTHWLGWRFDIQPTANWSLKYQQTYDFVRHTVTDQTFELHRDLHCWQAQFIWVPGGTRSGYYFRISVKNLPDIKIERSESQLLGGFGR